MRGNRGCGQRGDSPGHAKARAGTRVLGETGAGRCIGWEGRRRNGRGGLTVAFGVENGVPGVTRRDK